MTTGEAFGEAPSRVLLEKGWGRNRVGIRRQEATGEGPKGLAALGIDIGVLGEDRQE